MDCSPESFRKFLEWIDTKNQDGIVTVNITDLCRELDSLFGELFYSGVFYNRIVDEKQKGEK